MATSSVENYELNVALAAASRFAVRLSSLNAGLVGPDGSEAEHSLAPHSSTCLPRALAELRCVADSLWWTNADSKAIGHVYATARSWSDHSDEAAAAEELIRYEIARRFGVDVDQASGSAQLVQDQLERYELERLRVIFSGRESGSPE